MTLPVRAAALASLAALALGCAACTLPQPATPPSRPQSPPPALRAPALAAPRDIAALLPVSLTGLQAAATLAARFAAEYGTSRPGESPRTWLARLRPLMTAQLAATLTRAAIWQARHPATGQVISEQARDLTTQAAVFTVRIRQHSPAATGTLGYAVTVIRRPGGWAVYDIEPASAGNAG
jgi:hypothetical protein